jgi:hypothetical protein
LKTFPGIVVMTALETEKTQFDERGRPRANAPKVASPDAQKRLPADANVWVRLSHDAPPTLIGVRSVRHNIKPGEDKPKVWPGFNLGDLVFKYLGIGDTSAQVRDVPVLDADQADPTGEPLIDAKNRVWDAAKRLGWDMAAMFADYANSHDNQPITDATVEQLSDYLLDLQRSLTDQQGVRVATSAPQEAA